MRVRVEHSVRECGGFTRRRLLRLGLGGLLAAAGCDSADWLAPDEVPADGPATEPTAPSPDEQRAATIRAGLATLAAECQREAGGDWDHWVANLESFRTDLRARIAAARPNHPHAEGAYEARAPVLEARGDVPLFECDPKWYLHYLAEPRSLDAFRRTRPVAVVSRWLRGQGIDLIFLPIPKMSEVYAARVTRPCPASGIVAPHVRRMLRELLQDGVEILDLLPPFLASPDRDARPLYFPDDPHWGPRGWDIAARLLCERLVRYPWARAAGDGPPLFRATEEPCNARGVGYPALTAEQQRRVDRTRDRTLTAVRRVQGRGSVLSPDSPVIVIGDSCVVGFIEHLALHLNQPVSTYGAGGHTTHGFKEAVRNRALLRGKRVVVWVVSASSLPHGRWDLSPVILRGEQPTAA